jgi:hypothetical protein
MKNKAVYNDAAAEMLRGEESVWERLEEEDISADCHGTLVRLNCLVN